MTVCHLPFYMLLAYVQEFFFISFFLFLVMTDSLSFFSLCSVSFVNGLKVLKPLFDNSTYKEVGFWRQYFVSFLHSVQFSLSALLFCHSLSTVKITHLTSNPTARTKLDIISHRDKKACLSRLEMSSSFEVSDDLVSVFLILMTHY